MKTALVLAAHFIVFFVALGGLAAAAIRLWERFP
jgi:hypothetical protein